MSKLKYRYIRSFLLIPLLLSILFLFSFSLKAQERLVPLNKTFDLRQENAIIKADRPIHSSFFPMSEADLGFARTKLDSVQPILSISKRKDLAGWKRKFFHEHLFILDTQIVKLTLDPIYQFEYTHHEKGSDETLFKNSRGFLLQLQIGDKVAVGSSFLENQARLPQYIGSRVEATNVAYGQGRVKKIDTNYYDFAMSSAYVSYSPSKRINFTLGHGKHFIGNGFRSHLLSDLAFNYPYLKLKTNWAKGRIQYQNLYALFQDLERIPSENQSEELFERKMGAIHYLSFLPHKNFEIGLFESNIWPSIDSSGRQELPLNAYMPVIYLNSLIEDREDVLSSRVGLNLRYTPFKALLFYSQLSIQNFEKNNSSYQFGIKHFLFDKLRVGIELNSIRTVYPDSFPQAQPVSNRRDLATSDSFSHYNESLSLPYGGNQSEVIISAQYFYKRWNILGRMNVYSGDAEQRFILGEVSYMLNPAVNSNFYLNLTHRDVDDLMFISFGWRTSLENLYFNY